MHKHYNEYYWKNGKPYGKGVTDDLSGITFRIVVDPYYKRFSVEEYRNFNFHQLIYDSALFDFRALLKPEQAVWLREKLNDQTEIIRDEIDRIILIESYQFEEGFCRECRVTTPFNTLVSLHRLHYHHLGDAINGVILYDRAGSPVMKKTYALQKDSLEFGELLDETWEMETFNEYYRLRVENAVAT